MTDPIRVCSFESRRADDMRSLIERNGGLATLAPSMQEVPLDENPEVFDFADRVLGNRIDAVLFMTGVGARTLMSAIETRFDRDRFLAALKTCRLIVRGPKPLAVLRNEWKVAVDDVVPEPNTWKEVLAVFDKNDSAGVLPLSGRVIAVQEYGEPSDDLYQELKSRGSELVRVPVYRWALPDDTRPLEQAVLDTIAGQFDVLMFTSANQLNNVLAIADELSVRDVWITSANKTRIASIGPTASDKLRACGLRVDVEPEHPKMGHLVRAALERPIE